MSRWHGAFVAVRAVMLGRDVLSVLGQHVPADLEIDAVAEDLSAIAGVEDVHDLHVWTLTSGMYVATAHLVTRDESMVQGVLHTGRDLLRERHGVAHATLQVETTQKRSCRELHR